jgi:UDP-N-acetylglucosamine 2-epimerase (non-hydrolysing)
VKHVLHIVGARPNFMKVAPVVRALEGRARQTLVHTGQHYDERMSDVFFAQLGIRQPDVNLEVGSGTHAVQTAQIMTRLEPIIIERKPDLLMVYGDVNSTAAAALVCSKLLVPIAHVEAGLRSGDRTMPEEVNRRITDVLADVLFTPSADADENLAREGVSSDKIHCVGNVMIDTLVRLLPAADASVVRRSAGVEGPFVLVTLHRPSNVDEPAMLASILAELSEISQSIPVLFPIHPRTRQRSEALRFTAPPSLHFTEPLGYLEFLALQRDATAVVTDSGGVQEETTFLGVPCLTLRDNTERPVTVTHGTNLLLGRNPARMRPEVMRVLRGERKSATVPPLWDGHAGERIGDIVIQR